MIESWNDTNQYFIHNDVKRVYFLSLEYILGRLMQMNLLNNDLEKNYEEALKDIGYDIRELYEEEIDINLGLGAIGRVASCYVDSLTTQDIPCWAYGLRFDYGVFRQEFIEGEQVEIPDYWLEKGNPWEIERTDMTYKVRMYGESKKYKDEAGVERSKWEGGELILGNAYDYPMSGYNTFNTNSLRLFRGRPYDEYEPSMLHEGEDYLDTIERRQEAEYVTSIFFPNDKVQGGREMRLKQQYFFAACTVKDMIRRFRKNVHNWDEFPHKNAIHLNETHSAITIVEMLRILIDEQKLKWT